MHKLPVLILFFIYSFFAIGSDEVQPNIIYKSKEIRHLSQYIEPPEKKLLSELSTPTSTIDSTTISDLIVAYIATKTGLFDIATEKWLALAEKHHDRAIFAQAFSLTQQTNNIEMSMEVVQKWIKKYPDDIGAILANVYVSLEKNLYLDAIKFLDKMQEVSPPARYDFLINKQYISIDTINMLQKEMESKITDFPDNLYAKESLFEINLRIASNYVDKLNSSRLLIALLLDEDNVSEENKEYLNIKKLDINILEAIQEEGMHSTSIDDILDNYTTILNDNPSWLDLHLKLVKSYLSYPEPDRIDKAKQILISLIEKYSISSGNLDKMTQTQLNKLSLILSFAIALEMNETIENVLSFNSNKDSVKIFQAKLHFIRKDYDNAIEVLNSVNPSIFKIDMLTKIYIEQNDMEKLNEIIENTYDLDQLQQLYAINTILGALSSYGRYELTLEIIDDFILNEIASNQNQQLPPSIVRSRQLLIDKMTLMELLSYTELGLEDEIVDSINKVLDNNLDNKLSEEDWIVYNNIGYTFVNADKYPNIRDELLHKAYELDSSNTVIWDSLGWSYYKQGKKQLAIDWILAAYNADESFSIEIANQLAHAYWQSNKITEVKYILTNMNIFYKDHPILLENLEKWNLDISEIELIE